MTRIFSDERPMWCYHGHSPPDEPDLVYSTRELRGVPQNLYATLIFTHVYRGPSTRRLVPHDSYDSHGAAKLHGSGMRSLENGVSHRYPVVSSSESSRWLDIRLDETLATTYSTCRKPAHGGRAHRSRHSRYSGAPPGLELYPQFSDGGAVATDRSAEAASKKKATNVLSRH